MKELLFALMLALLPTVAMAQQQAKVGDNKVGDNADLEIIKFSWSRFQQSVSTSPSGFPSGLDMSGAGGFDPDPFRRRTNDLRVLERNLPKPIKGFAYKVKLRNGGTKTIKRLFWEYQFSDPASSETLSRRQFVCSVGIKPGTVKGLEVFSISPPSNVVSVASLNGESGDGLSSKVVINRVDYEDGTTWQRSDWAHPRKPPYPADLYPAFRRRSKCGRF